MNTNTLEGKTLLLVHAGSMRKKFIFDRLKELGVKIICLNKEKTALAEPYVDGWLIGDLKNTEECLKLVKQWQSDNPKNRIDGAVTFWDECILLTSRISDSLGLPGIPFAVSDRIKNKYVFRDACQEEGIAAPRHLLIRDEKDLSRVDDALQYPLVIKPVYGACSAFVVRVENHEELLREFATIKKNINTFWLAPEWNSLEVLVEEYIGGQEVDIDILLQNGEVKYISIIDNKETNEPFFVETGWSSPTRLSPDEQEQLKTTAIVTLNKLGVKNGCIHFEAKISPDDGAVPIEVNLRMGGGEVYLYSKLVWGVDLVENAVKIAMGIPVEVRKTVQPLRYLVSHRFLSTDSCRIEEIKVDPALYKKEYFVDLYFEKEAGEIFLAPPDGYDHSIGIITVAGSSRAETAANLADALTYIEYRTKSVQAEYTKN